jgi:hypothetical protein
MFRDFHITQQFLMMKNQVLSGCFLENIIGENRKCDQVPHDEYVSSSLIFLSAIFLALVIFPALLIVGPIKVNNYRLSINIPYINYAVRKTQICTVACGQDFQARMSAQYTDNANYRFRKVDVTCYPG